MTIRTFAIVIDDDPSVCKALRRLLRAAFMDVDTFTSAEGFLCAVLEREPDCLVLDIRMPGMSGPELRDRLRADGRKIPVVFITAHAEGENGNSYDDMRILRKPFDGQMLLNEIREAVVGGDG